MTTESNKALDEREALIARIDAAIKRITSGQGCMRIPMENTDPDIVLRDCRAAITKATGAAA